MSTLSNSDYDEDDDIVTEYEKQELDGNQGNVDKNEGFDSENEENKEENTARKVDPSSSKRHVVRNPLPKLNTERLKGPKGIHTIEKYFEGFKFHGHGYEKYDLDRTMKRLEHWGHRLFPKLDFDDFLERLEKLGSKKDLQVFIKKYRQDMINDDNDIINQDNMDAEEDKEQDEPIDEFDLLIAEQIEKQKQVMQQTSPNISTTNNYAFDNLLSQSNIKASQCSPTTITSQLTDEVKERIERNRQQAIQRRLARLKEQEEEIKRKKSEDAEYTNAENNKVVHLKNQECENNIPKTDKIHDP